MGALRKTMEYLGLADGEEYAYAEDEGHEGAHDGRGAREHDMDGDQAPARGHRGEDVRSTSSGSVRYGQVTPLHGRGQAVSPRGPERGEGAEEVEHQLQRITTIHPRTYNEAKAIGESFRSGVPVIMNLTDMTDADAKRLVDFSAGLVFGLRGAIERVTNKVFLLSPEHVAITGETVPPRPAHLFNQS